MNESAPAMKRRVWSLPIDGQEVRADWKSFVVSEGKDLLKQIRVWFLLRFRYRGARIGKSFHVGASVSIGTGLVAGDFVYIGQHSQLPPRVHIGHYSSLSAHVAIVGADHNSELPSAPWQGEPCRTRVTFVLDASDRPRIMTEHYNVCVAPNVVLRATLPGFM